MLQKEQICNKVRKCCKMLQNVATKMRVNLLLFFMLHLLQMLQRKQSHFYATRFPKKNCLQFHN